MIIKAKMNRGFTLIELLVVITIIAILATVATPMMNKARQSARMIPATNNAKQILLALVGYVGDSGGLYPEAGSSSNRAFRKLFPDNCDNEKMFWQQGDRFFCDPVKEPDEKIEDKDDQESGFALEAGENHWAYVSGLTDSARATTPIIADGFTGPNNTYDENHIWQGANKAIIGFVDGAARSLKLRDGEPRIPGQSTSLFEGAVFEDDEFVKVLNPLKRARPTAEDD